MLDFENKCYSVQATTLEQAKLLGELQLKLFSSGDGRSYKEAKEGWYFRFGQLGTWSTPFSCDDKDYRLKYDNVKHFDDIEEFRREVVAYSIEKLDRQGVPVKSLWGDWLDEFMKQINPEPHINDNYKIF